MTNSLTVRQKSLLRNRMFINGEWLASDATFPVINPSTNEEIAQVAKSNLDRVEQAIEAASSAFVTWQKMPARARSDILMKWYELILANQKDLAIIMTTEQGKPLTEALAETIYAAKFVRWFAEEGVRTYGDLIPSHSESARIVVNKKPIGVVGVITPWNFPLAMITRKVAPALAAGCTCVIKPSEITPLSAIAVVELAQKAGIPNGVINLVFGDYVAIGSALTASDKVRKISFTGSTRVGKILMQQSAATVKRLSLELGGNAPFIVFEDADIDLAVEGVMASKFRNTGQTCVCANRIFVHKSIEKHFLEALKIKVEKLQVSDGFEEGATQGPLINQAALDKVERHIKDAVDKGAIIESGGKRHDRGGLFFQPTVLSGVSQDAQINSEETFGPVAPISSFTSDQEVVDRANDTEFGLSAYFYTRDLSRAWKVAESLEVGIVGINEGIISTEVAPFGGVKQSGIGREGSKYGIDEYLESQYVLMGLG